MKITNYARSVPKISDQGGGPGGGTTPGWGRVPPIPPILDNPGLMMEGFRVKIYLLKVEREVILSFYEQKTPGLAMRKTCIEHIKYDGAGLQNHLKVHQVQWNLYLGKI